VCTAYPSIRCIIIFSTFYNLLHTCAITDDLTLSAHQTCSDLLITKSKSGHLSFGMRQYDGGVQLKLSAKSRARTVAMDSAAGVGVGGNC